MKTDLFHLFALTNADDDLYIIASGDPKHPQTLIIII